MAGVRSAMRESRCGRRSAERAKSELHWRCPAVRITAASCAAELFPARICCLGWIDACAAGDTAPNTSLSVPKTSSAASWGTWRRRGALEPGRQERGFADCQRSAARKIALATVGLTVWA